MLFSSAYYICIKIIYLRGEECSIKSFLVMDLIVCNPEGHHDICCGMGFREHVFYLLTRFDVPLRNAVLLHVLYMLFSKSFSLPDILHYLEGGLWLYTLEHQIVHYVIPRGYYFLEGGDLASYKLLGIVEPYVCSMGKS